MIVSHEPYAAAMDTDDLMEWRLNIIANAVAELQEVVSVY